MSEEKKSKIFFSLFFIFIVGIVLAGSYFLYFDKPDNKKKIINVSNKVKNDKKKDFIYFENSSVISEELALVYKEPVINFKGEEIKNLNNTLKEASAKIKDNVKKYSTATDEEKASVDICPDDIFTALMREYDVYQYDRFVSLVVREYTYRCDHLPTLNKYEAYVFDITTGTYLKQTDVLASKDILFSKVQSEVRNHLSNVSLELNEGEVINIEKTIAGLNDEAAIYIDNDGAINVEYIAKTENNNYNDNIIIK